jgi:hypothetical protein
MFRIDFTYPMASSISPLKTYCRASTEKYKAKKVPRMVRGKPNEKRFNCGADLVIKPIPRFIKNKILTIGNTIITAF